MSSFGLYLHIPFCRSKCRYCDFSAFAGRENRVEDYLRAVGAEMESVSGRVLSSLYIGGGTPTHLEDGRLRGLLRDIRRLFSIAPGAEWTVEVNPETLTESKADLMKEAGVNRLSFGLQTADDRLLTGIGRIHDWAGFQAAFRLARDRSFENLSVDLIYGLPGQSLDSWRDTLEKVLLQGPDHLSAYGLAVEEGTAFARQGVRCDPDLQADMYLEAHKRLTEAGYAHYEISNFARRGRECRHNLLYWAGGEYVGVGCSAASCLGGERRQNDPGLEGYIRRMMESGQAVVHRERLSGGPRAAEDLMLALRLSRGIPWPFDGPAAFGKVLGRYQREDFLDIRNGRARPTLRGWLLSNSLFTSLLEAGDSPEAVSTPAPSYA